MKASVFAAVTAVALSAPSSALAQSTLVDRAKKSRDRAERTLAEARRARLAERAKLTRAVQEAYAKLAAADAASERASTELQDAQRDEQAAESLRAAASRRDLTLARLLGQAADLVPAERADDRERFIGEVEARVDARIAAFTRDTRIHTRTTAVLGRDGRPGDARLLRIGRVATVALGSSEEDRARVSGFVREEAGGPPIVVGPVLSDGDITALEDAKPGRSGQLPFDLDGSLTRVEAEAPGTGAGTLKSGGVFVWPILAVGLLGALLFIERLWYFAFRPASPIRIRQVTEALEARETQRAAALVHPARSDLDRVLRVGIDTFDAPRATREQALETALLREEPVLDRGVALLGAVAGLAPLLGLLGTVTGMITTFDVISTFGTGNPRLLSGGISVALITTQLGLVVAVPALLAHAWVSRAVAKRQALLEEARTALLSLQGERP